MKLDDRDIEKIFDEGFDGFEPAFEENDWKDMAKLLEEEDKGIIIFFRRLKNKFNPKKLLIIMTLIPLITAVYLSIGIGGSEKPTNNVKNTNPKHTIEQEYVNKSSNNPVNEEKSIENTVPSNAEFKPKSQEASSANDEPVLGTASTVLKPRNYARTEAVAQSKMPTTPSKTFVDSPGLPSVAKVLATAKTVTEVKKRMDGLMDSTIYKNGSVVRYEREWVNEQYEYDCDVHREKPIKDFWMAGYYTQQQNQNTSAGDITHGFNAQFMSGNLIKHNRIGVYGGLDWGMQFYGRTPNENVALNTNQGDSGFSRLRNNAMDFTLKMNAEYNTKYFAPYVNAGFGPRLYYTNQRVKSYVPLKDVESSDVHNINTNVSLMWNVGVGTRVKVAKRVSLDLRYDISGGTKTEIVDLNNTQFNGLNYNVVKKDYTPNYSSFRFGVVIDLSEGECEKTKISDGHWVTKTVDSTVIENISDSSVIVLPCDKCPCEDDKKDTREQIRKQIEDAEENEIGRRKKRRLLDILEDLDNNSGSGSGSSGGSGGGSKGGFPGIKSPGRIDH